MVVGVRLTVDCWWRLRFLTLGSFAANNHLMHVLAHSLTLACSDLVPESLILESWIKVLFTTLPYPKVTATGGILLLVLGFTAIPF